MNIKRYCGHNYTSKQSQLVDASTVSATEAHRLASTPCHERACNNNASGRARAKSRRRARQSKALAANLASVESTVAEGGAK